MTEASQAAIDLIVAEEVTSEEVYRKRYQRPEWPGGQSGVTVGIGYDLGYSTPAVVEADWKGLLPDDMIADMASACGMTGDRARILCGELRAHVLVPWEAAMTVFKNRDVPKWSKTVRETLPNTDKLSPDSFGALVSLAYNRGASFGKAGDRYIEMRAIYAHMAHENFAAIPAELRQMKRLWPGVSGLLNRREHEAALFQRGLTQGQPQGGTT